MTPTDLLAKLEEAECGSRELDFLCWWYGQSTESVKANPQPPDADYMAAALASPHGLPAYTRSVDAALSLVPEGYSWEVRKSGFGNPAQTRIWDPRRSPAALDPGNDWRATNKTGCAAVAICSAALRARAVMGEKP